MTAQLLAKRPTIKILLYTDDPNAISNGKNLLGLSSMIDRLHAHGPSFATLVVKWVSRSSDLDHHADNKLNTVLRREVEQTGEPFDEIWFFGLHQANTAKFSLSVFRGGPQSELDASEVDALEQWMKVQGGAGGGGVLMTGDHNNPAPPNWLRNQNGQSPTPSQTPELLGLGRAIGHCVPRAGQLRKWHGPPSSSAENSLNTLASTGFQTDRLPQKITLELVNADGVPDRRGQPHPLFFYRSGSFIDVFPDHRHEGALVIPDLSNKSVWPTGPNGQPKPCVVAFGTDRRKCERINLVTAYDGDHAGVGRIVADSSWHHYVNINLKGFPHPAPANSDSDKIGQFYGNLAIWLAPLHKRRQMAQAMYEELADYTLLLEQPDNTIRTGKIAYKLLGRSTSPCEIHELLRAFGQEQFSQTRLSESRIPGELEQFEQQTLGLVLDSFQKEAIRAQQANERNRRIDVEAVVRQGRTKAMAAGASSGSSAVQSGTTTKRLSRRVVDTAMTPATKEWTIEIRRDARTGDESFLATLVFHLETQNGVVTGRVWDGVDLTFLSDVRGTHQPSPAAESLFMSLEFTWGDKAVKLSGITTETPATVFFSGRYTASVLTVSTFGVTASAVDLLPPSLVIPADGDTGTGTGQQT